MYSKHVRNNISTTREMIPKFLHYLALWYMFLYEFIYLALALYMASVLKANTIFCEMITVYKDQ